MNSLAPFPFARIRLQLGFLRDGALPRYKGSALRGVFGHALKEIACLDSGRCGQSCERPDDCPYGRIFESTRVDLNGRRLDVPHPFVLFPGDSPQERVRVGDSIEIELCVFGWAVERMPLLLGAIERMGQWGLGAERMPFRLIRTARAPDQFADLLQLAQVTTPCTAVLDTVTPLHIKQARKMSQRIDLQALIKAVVRRLSGLHCHHCGGTGRVPIHDWLELARRATLTGHELLPVRMERFSSRQDRKLLVGGLAGRLAFRAVAPELCTLLRMGELAHVGKGTSYGFGRYRLRLMQDIG